MNLGGPRIGMRAVQGQTLIDALQLLACVTIHQEQRVHARDHGDRLGIFGIYLHCVDEFAPRVRPTTHVHQLRPADAVVGLVTIGLQNPFPVAENLSRPIATAAQLKFEHGFTPGEPYCHKYA